MRGRYFEKKTFMVRVLAKKRFEFVLKVIIIFFFLIARLLGIYQSLAFAKIYSEL